LEAHIILVVVAADPVFGFGSWFVVLPRPLVRPKSNETTLTVALVPAPPHTPPSQDTPE